MVVWEFPCESRTLLGFYLEKPVANATGFLSKHYDLANF
jgi:hypothetical protein